MNWKSQTPSLDNKLTVIYNGVPVGHLTLHWRQIRVHKRWNLFGKTDEKQSPEMQQS